MRDKNSTPSLIAAYRRRQQRAEMMLVVFWIVVMIVVLGAGYLVYRLLRPGPSAEALSATGTTTPTLVASLETAASTPEFLSETQAAAITETPASSPTPTAPSVRSYTVKEGDTMISIAVQAGVNLPTLEALNPNVTPSLLGVGQQILIPIQGENAPAASAAPGSTTLIEYKIVSGDTLASIAARFGTTVDAIVRENNLADANQIQIGETLKIPASSTPVPGGTSLPAAPAEATSTPLP
jgi:LysM repeat protein